MKSIWTSLDLVKLLTALIINIVLIKRKDTHKDEMFDYIWFLKNKFLLLKDCACISPASLTATASTYTGYQGDSLTITCNGLNIVDNDIIWQFYPIGSPANALIIWQNGVLQSGYTNGRYTVNTITYVFGNLSTSLTISGLQPIDANYVYSCSCNIYQTCKNGNTASASAQIIQLSNFNFKLNWYVKCV